VLSYRVTSIDGHPIGGSLTFSVGHAGGTVATPPVDAGAGPGALLWLARVVLYGGLFLGVGGAFFRACFAPEAGDRATDRLLRAVLLTGMVAATLSMVLQGLDALDAPLGAVATWSAWRAGLETTFAWTVLAALVAMSCALFSLRNSAETSRRIASLTGLVGVGAALSLSGHASSAEPQWVTRSAVFVHGVAVAYWIGALAPLASFVSGGPKTLRATIRAWSTGAVFAVAALVVTGAALAFVQVQRPDAMIGTAYGQILTAKLVLVAALLSLAAFNRYRLTPRLETSRPWAERRLAASARLELALAVVIFGLVGLWRFTPPPRALTAPTPMPGRAPAIAHIPSAQAMAQVILSPGRPGPTRVQVTVEGPAGPLDPKEVTVSFWNPDAGVEPIERKASRAAPGQWDVTDLVLPAPGSWQIRLDLLITDFDKAVLEGDAQIRP